MRQIDRQPGIVELAVMIKHPAPQAFGIQRRGQLQHLLARQPPRLPKTQFAGHPVIDFEPDTIIGAFPPFVIGDDKGLVLDQVRRIAAKDPAFMQRFGHQFDIALLQIPDPAMDELGRTRRSSFGKIIFFHQQGAEAAGSGVDRYPQSGGATPDNTKVPGLDRPFVGQGFGSYRFVHHSVQAIAALMARRHPFNKSATWLLSIAGVKRRSTAHCCCISSTDPQ